MYYLFSSIARIMPTKSMLLNFLAALYICNGVAAGDLEFGETLSGPYRAALHRRDTVTGCPDPTWAQCPGTAGCCQLASQCDSSNGHPFCNVPCNPGPGVFLCSGFCCTEGSACINDFCTSSTSTNGKFSVSLEPGHRYFDSNNVLS